MKHTKKLKRNHCEAIYKAENVPVTPSHWMPQEVIALYVAIAWVGRDFLAAKEVYNNIATCSMFLDIKVKSIEQVEWKLRHLDRQLCLYHRHPTDAAVAKVQGKEEDKGIHGSKDT
jgi:hypothetical protein